MVQAIMKMLPPQKVAGSTSSGSTPTHPFLELVTAIEDRQAPGYVPTKDATQALAGMVSRAEMVADDVGIRPSTPAQPTRPVFHLNATTPDPVRAPLQLPAQSPSPDTDDQDTLMSSPTSFQAQQWGGSPTSTLSFEAGFPDGSYSATAESLLRQEASHSFDSEDATPMLLGDDPGSDMEIDCPLDLSLGSDDAGSQVLPSAEFPAGISFPTMALPTTPGLTPEGFTNPPFCLNYNYNQIPQALMIRQDGGHFISNIFPAPGFVSGSLPPHAQSPNSSPAATSLGNLNLLADCTFGGPAPSLREYTQQQAIQHVQLPSTSPVQGSDTRGQAGPTQQHPVADSSGQGAAGGDQRPRKVCSCHTSCPSA